MSGLDRNEGSLGDDGGDDIKGENSSSVSSLRTPNPNDDGKIKIFVSYSHKDKQHLLRLQKQLYNLTHTLELIECWDDREIVPSTLWDDEIQAKMDSADLFLFLISQDFISSDYVMTEEVPYAIKRFKNKRAHIIPILIRSVSWELLPDLNQFQALPASACPVTDKIWENEDKAWKDVEIGLTKYIINRHKSINNHSIECLASCMESISNLAYGPPSSGSSVSASQFGENSSISPLTTDANTSTSTKDCINVESIGSFYKNYHLKEGDLISITCTMSSYGPLVIGSPFKKRKAHLRFRKGLSGDDLSDDSDSDSDSDDVPSDEEESDDDNGEAEDKETSDKDEGDDDEGDEEREAKTDCMLAFTAGQMVWRMADNLLDWNFLGLYQSIVRNSIPLFVNTDYYKEVVDAMFTANNTSTVEATIVGRIITLPSDFTALFQVDQETKASTLMNTTDVKPKIRGKHNKDQPPFGIAVLGKDDGTSISYHGKSYYLDGDIWVAIEDGKTKKTSIISRFCNIADEDDINELVGDLKKELKKLNSYKVVFQFDQEKKRFSDKKKTQTSRKKKSKGKK